MIKKHIRYSKIIETEVTLLIYFCKKLKNLNPSIKKNTVLLNIFKRELVNAKKKTEVLHEDLQYDFEIILNELSEFK
jgi:hypothetical protein